VQEAGLFFKLLMEIVAKPATTLDKAIGNRRYSYFLINLKFISYEFCGTCGDVPYYYGKKIHQKITF